jgi:16S rRNA (cytosine967-C5)-methyltransferase
VRDAYANLALPAILRRHRLRDRDAALATELGYGTLRAPRPARRRDRRVHRPPLVRVEPTLLDALRLGAYSCCAHRVPPHAAVDTTVELVRVEAGSRAAGFVNAVLRRVGERDEKAWVQQLAPDAVEDPLGHTAFAHAHPRWIAQAFADALGGEAELDEALAADDARPVVHLLARPGEITAEELALVTGGTEAPYSPYGVHLEAGSGDVGELDAVGGGVGDRPGRGQPAGGPRPHPCAAARRGHGPLARPRAQGPGGKSVLLGALLAFDDGHLDAVEPERAPRRPRAPCRRRPAGGRAHRRRPRRPAARGRLRPACSWTPRAPASGALRRRPEARWRRRPDDVAALAKLQRELLTAALRHVRPGGVVAYVTCSPHLAETHGVLRPVLRKHPEVEQLDARPLLPGCRTSATARACSCGRTGTAPTRCSSAAAEAGRVAFWRASDDRPQLAGRRLRPSRRGSPDRRRRAGHGADWLHVDVMDAPLRAQPHPRPARGAGPAEGDDDPASTATS